MNRFFLPLLAALLIVVSACKKKEKTETEPDDTNNNTDLTFTDSRDSKTYKYVKIGSQYWMAENLRYETATGETSCYNNNSTNCTTFGVLYDQTAALAACPSGWHLPSNAEFQTLEKTIGFSDADTTATSYRGDGSSLKNGGSTGFNVSVYPGLYDNLNDQFVEHGVYAFYRTSVTRVRGFRTSDNKIGNLSSVSVATTDHVCVRCIKD